ncbi:bifunctional sugar phosphate isomerase/epimerase/4-hydroxyphenylpyruvate dioxygenase family protein [Sphingomonas sp. SUN039]|uniref:bifunctional sugar phosphate isomerase/epimerase/4-hydroxyphenylpyruvate dioxygenase family protein n=1 Tax=Sphingomonas sp. SUN039 TaxID=2937787 RepID=UPI0021640564|nr:sugar phosphate isomerase/epimerase and 4-hydroxyphenylpyruvate domain-containing protein [Sphingomonas sp. SUN039]UVO53131.1 sugar phosphate isomerase/epimerase and 4-hydroxyphenylpyruvate domain-containing protein [Sphingomonas sp. SUN039]
MLTSIATVSISGTLDTKLRAIAAAGFDGVEVFENDLLSCPLSPTDIGKMLRDLGLVCTVFQPFRDFEGMPDELRARTFDRAERKFDLMAALGTDLMLVCSNVSPHASGDRNRIIDDFSELGERLAKRDLRVGYEALAWGRHVFDHREAWGIVRDVAHPNIGLILDSFHSLAHRIPSSSIGDIDRGKLFLVQIADAPLMQLDHLSWARHFRNFPGQGEFPVAEYAAEIMRIGYDGYWSLEIFNDRFRAGSASGVATDGYRSLQVMQDAAARVPRAPFAPVMPVPADVSRVAFIEFAVDEAEAAALGDMLSALGFAATGRHRRKSVVRWQQGDINIVLNTEVEGFAHSHDVVHGGSVCALGLVVPDVEAAMARAAALAIPAFAQAVGPDEMQIPSVRGIGGSLIYFIAAGGEDEVWAREFVATGVAAPGIGLTAIDHIAQTMIYEEFLGALLYYVALFDVTKTPQVEIADPLGLVQSQAVESRNKALRITLNGSLAQQTLSNRFVAGYMGAGVQHIAFACPDAFAAAEAARAQGLAMLDIPRNYYDDLQARYGLDGALVERMAALGILYDRDGDAEYFQFYSRAFAKRVFFEIVERRDYAGYGAANAGIRLAAQSRFKSDLAA